MGRLLLSRFSHVRLCDPIDGSPPGSPVPGILQARTLGGLPLPSPRIPLAALIFALGRMGYILDILEGLLYVMILVSLLADTVRG